MDDGSLDAGRPPPLVVGLVAALAGAVCGVLATRGGRHAEAALPLSPWP
ncbi:hypothetical protein [Streptomyces sp. KHY 26]